MGKTLYQSWGRQPSFAQEGRRLWWRSDAIPPADLKTHPSGVLPFGNGRSYGDACLNEGGLVLDCRGLNRFIGFQEETGVLRCEGGTSLADILALVVGKGWFLPVTPGTRFVTVGGAIANDVHGKNHHRAGTFGRHVLRFELLRSDGSRRVCSPAEHPEWYAATIGGLGLTGLITWAEIQLQPIASPFIDRETVRFGNLSEFRALADESDEAFDYTVAWIDCLGRGRRLGRGLFFRGNHAKNGSGPTSVLAPPRLSVPFTPPISLVNGLSLRLFNTLYYRKTLSSTVRERVHFAPFFYPLDALKDWNRIYGPRGFFQYQCALPDREAESATGEILARIAEAGTGSFLAVLKRFGDIPSPGLLSFPREGFTLALDFPNRGARTLELLDRLDDVTRGCGGAVNPSKDARMSPETFQASFPSWNTLSSFRDPAFSSSFWRRVTRQDGSS